jgi:hypothetical protein
MKIEYDHPPRGPPGKMQGSFGFEEQYDIDDAKPVFYPD